MKFGSSVILAPFRLFGFSFNYLAGSEGTRFLAQFKEAVPMRMWDSYARRWWVPELYSSIVQTIADDFGALDQKALQQLTQLRQTQTARPQGDDEQAAPMFIVQDYYTLGLVPHAPPRLVEMAIAYWRSQFAQVPAAALEAEAAEEAYARIQAYLLRTAQP